MTTIKARDLKPGDKVSRPATQRGETPVVVRTVFKVTPLPEVSVVRVTFTDCFVVLMPDDNDVVTA